MTESPELYKDFVTEIDEELAVLRRDKDEFIADLDDIENEIAALQTEKSVFETVLKELEDELAEVEDEYRPNILTDEETDAIVGLVYEKVAQDIAAGAAAIICANGDVSVDSSEEHLTYVTTNRTVWMAKEIVDRLLTKLEEITD